VVRNYDVDLPANTIRAWVIGMLLCTIGSAVNMLFSLRNPSVTVTTYVIQLVAYPIGLGWDLVMPDKEMKFLGIKFNLRPGRFNFKEHVVIVVMSNVSAALPIPTLFLFPCGGYAMEVDFFLRSIVLSLFMGGQAPQTPRSSLRSSHWETDSLYPSIALRAKRDLGGLGGPAPHNHKPIE